MFLSLSTLLLPPPPPKKKKKERKDTHTNTKAGRRGIHRQRRKRGEGKVRKLKGESEEEAGWGGEVRINRAETGAS